ncbi:MAG: hypothetical protein JSR29_05550 [Nitrospira sp.]|nr:hypothetical protein [Nitrospira sp.]
MNPDLNEWNLVVVGQWNPHIFSPQWMCNTLLNVPQVESEFVIGPLGGGMRYLTDHLAILPGQDRLIIGMRDTLDATLEEAEHITLRALDLLRHTPIRAAGVNFLYTEEVLPESVLRTFQLADNDVLADAGYEVSSTEIVRDIRVGDAVLKLKMVHSDQQPAKFYFNFHHVIDSPARADTILRGQTVGYRDRALRLLRDFYHLTVDNEGNNVVNNPNH